MLQGMADEAFPSAPTRDPSVPPAPDAARSSTPVIPERGEAPEARWFGFREVDPNAKAPMVRQVFDSVATNYDVMNDLMSVGIHRLWKSTLIEMIKPRPGMTLLDVAGGTGDISFRFLDAAGGTANAFVCDINEQMILVGRDRAIDRGVLDGVNWIVGDAEKVPLKSRSVDVYTIAFGLRNVTRIDAALAEARRVLKPGGRFFCLEFSRVVLPVLRDIYDQYSFTVLPRLGQMVAGDREAYQYLVESIRQFPDQESLVGRIEAAGFGQVRYRNLTGGVAAIHSGWRL
jgi:demethylmenaquinone methyltransferase / 2-methoxy-6-polyprenyl-1,4-benzoquinol methylase